MKLLLTLLPALLTQTTGRRNQRIVIGFLLFTTVLVALFSIRSWPTKGGIILISPASTGR